MFLANSIKRLIKGGEKRNAGIKKNIAASFLVRGLSIAINFSIVPLTIQYVEPIRYGIWITLASLVSWFTFFDFGMGHGLRNKLTTALAHQQYDQARKYISTTYAVLALIASAIFLVFCFINPLVNWNHFLNIPSTIDENIYCILLIVVGAFCVQFVFQVLNTVLTSLHEPARAELLTLLGQALLLVSLIVLKHFVKGSLNVLVLALNVAPVLVLLSASLFLYNGKLRHVAPSLKSVDFRYARSILNIGGAFFLIQLGALVLFQTDNVIITKILGPEAVTKFNVTYKLYSIIIMAFSIVANPYWSAFTEAYAKNDFVWIANSVKRLREIWLFEIGIVVPCFLIAAKYIFRLWLPDTISINFSLSVLMSIYVACYTCLSLNCYFLNGVGKLRLQLILYLVVMATNIPLGIVLCKRWGAEGIVISNIAAFVFMNVLLWTQTNKIIARKAVGIWNA